jgi:uncharacterized membrane protein YtjA (UPF0391 family)
MEEENMDLLNLGFVALIVAFIAGALGFSGVAGGASGLAKGIFGLFLVAAVLIFIMVFSGVTIPL